ncbi:MAG: phosphoribosylanthranilate isomerase [Dehalococcoidia bacterium]
MKHQTKIKICGIKNITNAKCVLENNADYIGLIFVKKSKRYIDFFTAKNLIMKIRNIPSKTKIVGIFQDENLEIINNYYINLGLDFVQIAGNYNDEFLEKIKHPKIIQISIKNNHTKEEICKLINHHKELNHKVLIDSFDKNIGGGTGKKFNWNIVKDFLGINGIFLAGGLNSNNINSAMKLMPWGIDISTGVETDGEKDNNKISEFISMVKNYAK